MGDRTDVVRHVEQMQTEKLAAGDAQKSLVQEAPAGAISWAATSTGGTAETHRAPSNRKC